MNRFLYILIAFALVFILGSWMVWNKYKGSHHDLWFPVYWEQRGQEAVDGHLREGPQHIILTLVDHFEPGGDYEYLAHWIEQYLKVVNAGSSIVWQIPNLAKSSKPF